MARISSIEIGGSSIEIDGESLWLRVEVSARVGRRWHRGHLALNQDLDPCGDSLGDSLDGDVLAMVEANASTAIGRGLLRDRLIEAAMGAIPADTLARLRADALYDADTGDALSADDLDCTDERYAELVRKSAVCRQPEGRIEFRGRRVYAQ